MTRCVDRRHDVPRRVMQQGQTLDITAQTPVWPSRAVSTLLQKRARHRGDATFPAHLAPFGRHGDRDWMELTAGSGRIQIRNWQEGGGRIRRLRMLQPCETKNLATCFMRPHKSPRTLHHHFPYAA